MASPSESGDRLLPSGEGHPLSSGEVYSPLVHGGESTATPSTVGGLSLTEIGVADDRFEHRAVSIGGGIPHEGPRTVDTVDDPSEEGPRTAEPFGGGLATASPSGVGPAAMGDPGSSDSATVSSTLVRDGADDRPEGGDNVAMQGGESSSEPMEVDVRSTGAQISEVEMDIGGIHVLVEQRPAGEGADTGSQESLVPSDLLSASLVTEVPVGGEEPSAVVVPGFRRDLGKEKVVVEEARDSSSGGEEMEVGASDPVVVPAAVGSSRAPGYMTADTLEGARDEDLAWTLQEDPTFVEVMAGERVPEHVQDMFLEEE
ncbi:hypothetical protein RHMOL_Rhmol10G0013300 [Rhododendron molle]|uniref:Uncharacterized protein n=1 Tax=Rhododendron molle TaxID=49168 RepID=A0ACC0LYT9_RHOML|nr:hypothetical protein RHMOL_Rhmol10G0013300 [Rhododendron molle]